jgi:RHS repeat-associated protein
MVPAQRISRHVSPPAACSGRGNAREAGVGGDRAQRRSRSHEWRQPGTPNGELFTKTDSETGDVTTYHYDALGNLLSVELPDSTLIEYVIDGQNRRIGKKVDGVLTKAWLYKDQLKPIAELDGAGNLVGRFVYGSKSNTPDVVMKYNAGVVTTYRVISDHLGSPIMAVNVNNASDVPFKAEYSAFGERTVTSGASSEDWMPFGFAGGMYDADTGLTRFGARDYDPEIGRWIAKDPTRWDGGQGNLYVYAGNDPINWLDPDGREGLAIIGGAVSAFGAVLMGASLVSNPVGWTIIGAGVCLMVYDAIDEATGNSQTIDNASKKLEPYRDYQNRQQEQFRELDQSQ